MPKKILKREIQRNVMYNLQNKFIDITNLYIKELYGEGACVNKIYDKDGNLIHLQEFLIWETF